jgi:hypothetical protein
MKEEQEMKFVSNLQVKQKGMERELTFVDDWCRDNNFIHFALDKYPQKSYFDTLNERDRSEWKYGKFYENDNKYL